MKQFVQLLPIAYLDPGSGSFIMQIIIAFLLAGLFVVKSFWNRVKAFFGNLFFSKEKNEKFGS